MRSRDSENYCKYLVEKRAISVRDKEHRASGERLHPDKANFLRESMKEPNNYEKCIELVSGYIMMAVMDVPNVHTLP